ncbi:MAG: hypothetical protein RL328_1798 [Acidobacteriota bacterium]
MLHSQRNHPRRGQVMFMLALAALVLFGMMGLAVDLGWSFFVKRAAQAAVDAGAMAAMREALAHGVPGSFTCGTAVGVYCAPAPVPCDTVLASPGTYLNLVSGCRYAEANGFTHNGHGNRQEVMIQSNDRSSPPPGAPGVNDVRYWVRLSITETIPQMFSAVLGNPNGRVTARATAGAVHTVLPASFYSLNREGDCMGTGDCGVDINLGGNGSLSAPNGLVMSSRCHGKAAGCDAEAGIHNGGGRVVNTSAIQIRLTGTADSNTAYPGWTNGADGASYVDPTAKLAQPPLVTTDAVKTCGILNGLVSQPGNAPVVLGPYNYYAYTLDRRGNRVPVGAGIELSGDDIRFSPSGTCPGVLSTAGATQTSAFPAYFFYGGLRAANGSNVTFGAGQYVLVGSMSDATDAGPAFASGGGNSTMTTAAGASNMFITTAPTSTPYPGLAAQMISPEIQLASASLYQGYIDLKAGNNSAFTLRGYVKTDGPASLEDYNGVLFWQDRRNSTVKYNLDGTYACAGPDYVSGCAKSSAELSDDRVLVSNKQDSRVAQVNSTANFGTGINGVLYQPRGAWLSMQGNGDLSAGLQIVTGALRIGGGGDVTLNKPSIPLLQFIAALIE